MKCNIQNLATICLYLLRIFIAASFFLMLKLSVIYVYDLQTNEPPTNVRLDLAVLDRSLFLLSLYPLLVASISLVGLYIYVTNARGFKGKTIHSILVGLFWMFAFFALIVAHMNYNDTIMDTYKTKARQQMRNYTEKSELDSTWSQKLWNQLQAAKKCCGINGPEDYYDGRNQSESVFPDSCRLICERPSCPAGETSLNGCGFILDIMWIDRRSCAYLEAFGCFLLASFCFLYRKLEPNRKPSGQRRDSVA